MVHVLDAASLDKLRSLLASAGTEHWRPGSGEGERLILEARDRTVSLPLPAGDRSATMIVTLLEGWIPRR